MAGIDENPDRVIAVERAVRDAEAEGYDSHRELTSWDAEAINACLRRLLELGPTSRVIDAGCGTGADLHWLLDGSAVVIGVDHSPRSLELARRRLSPEQAARVELVEGDLRALPLAPAAGDRLICSGVLQHLPTADYRLQCVREFFRVLEPGGIATIAAYKWLGHTGWRRDDFFQSEHGRIPFHGFSSRELRGLLADAGFTEIAVSGVAILPRVSKRLGIKPEAQARLAFKPLIRHLGGYLVARGVRPTA